MVLVQMQEGNWVTGTMKSCRAQVAVMKEDKD